MFRQRQREVRTDRERPEGKNRFRAGSSLIIVVCVSAFLVAFALAIVYTGSMLMARANRKMEQERCYQLARSFARVLDGELFRYSKKEDLKLLNGDPKYPQSFYRFACQFLEDKNYQEYNPAYPELTTYYYQYDTGEEPYGKITLILRKENDQETDILEGSFLSGSASGTGSSNPLDIVMANISRFTLHVEVEAEVGGVTCSYHTSYHTRVRYTGEAVTFTVGSDRIYWDDANKQWLDYANHPRVVPAETLIHYKITPGFAWLKSCSFEKTIKEAGDPESVGGSEP